MEASRLQEAVLVRYPDGNLGEILHYTHWCHPSLRIFSHSRNCYGSEYQALAQILHTSGDSSLQPWQVLRAWEVVEEEALGRSMERLEVDDRCDSAVPAIVLGMAGFDEHSPIAHMISVMECIPDSVHSAVTFDGAESTWAKLLNKISGAVLEVSAVVEGTVLPLLWAARCRTCEVEAEEPLPAACDEATAWI